MDWDVQLVEFAGFGPEISAVIISGSVFGACCLCISVVQFVRWLKYRHDNALDTTGRANQVNITYESTYWVRHGISWGQLGEHWQCARAPITCLLSALLLWVVRSFLSAFRVGPVKGTVDFDLPLSLWYPSRC